MELPRSESEAIRLIAKGDEQVFEELFRTWYASLVMYAGKFLSDKQEAENIVQMVFVKYWEKRNELKINSLKGYLLASVRNGCINELRIQKHHLSVDSQYDLTSFDNDEAAFTNDELLDSILAKIDEMPPQRKRIFKMGRFEGLKYKEIASVLGLSPKTVEVQMGKALKTLREIFNPDYKNNQTGIQTKSGKYKNK